MIEKMGGVYDGEEETLMKRALSILDEEMDDKVKSKAKDAYEEYYAEHPEEEEEVVYRYRLMPEVFLGKE